MIPQRERLTKRRRDVLAYVDEHGEITIDDAVSEWGLRPQSVHQTLWKMHAAELLRVKAWRRQKQGPMAPVFARFTGQPDARKPRAYTAVQKVMRYRARLKEGHTTVPRGVNDIFRLFVVQPLRRTT